MGRHGGHSFIYLQEVLQDSRALTIQLLADAQQGRQAIQVSPFCAPPKALWSEHRPSVPLSSFWGQLQYMGNHVTLTLTNT